MLQNLEQTREEVAKLEKDGYAWFAVASPCAVLAVLIAPATAGGCMKHQGTHTVSAASLTKEAGRTV